MKKIVITKEQSGIRIDKFLASTFAKSLADKVEFFSYTRGELTKKIKNGEVLINNKVAKPSYVLRENDVLEIERLEEKKNDLIPNKDIMLDILFENNDIAVINKPAGVIVHPSSAQTTNTITNALVAKYPDIRNVHDASLDSWLRPGIVHRLDKDTSGVMVVAKNMKSFEELKRIFKERLAVKIYAAVCMGTFKEKEGLIEKQIARSSNYRKQVIAGRKTKTKRREAATEYKVIEEYDGYSYVEASPKTGRMHQIRIHLASLGHPIVGDSLYAKKKARSNDRIIKRQLLHAKNIKFVLFGKKYAFSAPLPQDFAEFLASIRKR